MGSRRAGSDHHTIEVLLLNPFFDLVNTAFRTRIKVPLDKGHLGERLGIISKRFHIQVAGNIGSAMANKYSDPDVIVIIIRQRLSPFLTSIETQFQRHVQRHWRPGLQIREHP